MILWEFGTGLAVFQIWVPFWHEAMPFKQDLMRNFWVQMFDAVQPRKPRNYGKKILCQVLFIGLKEDTNTNTTQHILSWKVCKGSTFLRFSKTNRLILSSEKAKVLFDSSSQLWKQRSLFFCHRWPPRKNFRPTMGSKEGWKRSWRQCSRTALIFVGWSGGVSGGTQKLGGFEKWPPFFLWNNIDGV